MSLRSPLRVRPCAARALVATALALLLSAGATAQPITVSAAASLTDAFKAIGARFEARRPGTTVRLNFAASGVLLQQIAQGAPADVFASADPETMRRAVDQGQVDVATRRDFATNTLVLVEPLQGGLGLRSLQELAAPAVRRIAVGKPATVPAGRYTLEALDAAGLRAAVAPRFVQADSVRQVLDYVGRGEVDAGFVYRSDAVAMSDRVRVVRDAPVPSPVTYPVAVVAATREPALARAFVEFLATAEAREALARHGFAPAP